MNKSVQGAAGLLVVLALVAAGCGSGSKELTKSEFVNQGNAICVEAAEERDQLLKEFAETTNPNQNQEAVREKLLGKILPIYEGAASQIDELGAPAGDEAKVEAIVTSMEEAAERAKANPQSVAVSDLPFRKANEAAESYGLKACTI